ncbi:MAG: ABC transporter ATP-binding protein [Pseudomonadales bacterium]
MFRFFESLTQPYPKFANTQPPHGLVAFCRHYTRGMEGYLLVLSVLSALVAFFEAALFYMMGQLVDWLVDQDPQTLWQSRRQELLGFGFMVVVLLPGLIWLRSTVMHQTLLGNYPMAIRWRAHQYLLGQSMTFYQDEFAGRVATKMMQTALSVRETVMKLLDVMVYVTVYFFSMVFLVGQSDPILMLPMLGWLLGYIGVLRYFLPKLRASAMAQADARSMMTGRVVDSYTNIQTVKLFSHSKRESTYAQDAMDEFLHTVYRQMRYATGINVSVNVLIYLLIFCVGAFSIYLWSNAAITVGAIAVAITMALRLNGLAQWIMWEVGMLFENLGMVADGRNTLSRPQGITDVDNAPVLAVDQGQIAFEDVRFHYGKESGVLEDFNLTIKPGEKIGLVGRSGAGKSTLVNLLLRFYDVESGVVRIDGQPVNQVTQDSLRAAIGMVTQDTSLLHRSIRENLLYGAPDATDEDMVRAAKEAKAHDFIQTLTDPFGNTGYDAQVGERGVKLSGGQRQRIAIARVMLKNAPILVLDEATSALDSEVEASIQESLKTLMKDKTVIAIAHRLSTIAAMDRLVVLDQGQIVEQGTHSELVNAGGIYAKLWSHQTGGFLGLE